MGPKTTKKGRLQKKSKNEKKDLEVVNKLKRLLKEYELQCAKRNSMVDMELKDMLKNHISEGTIMCKFVLQGRNSDKSLLPKKISPLVKAIRTNWYKMIKDLSLWEMEIPREEISDLMKFFEQSSYPVEYLELLDCKIDSYSLQEFSKCFAINHSLTSLVLDYTNLQFDGLVALCSGLKGTRSIVKLSLCYCNLTSSCGQTLGKTISACSIRELYVDGNCLECIGLIDIIQLTVAHAEQERIEQQTLKTTEAQALQQQNHTSPKDTSTTGKLAKEVSGSSKFAKDKKKKKKKKKGRKSAIIKTPPKCGPYLSILHIADNGIDGMSVGGDGNLLLEAMQLIGRWISTSKDLTEIDLDGNLIGELGGREILTSLKKRKDGGLKAIYMKVTHRLNGDVFKSILSLASGSSKRGGKKKKKKKGKPGKRKV